jgi:Protein of unknown function (DUF3822)
LLIGKLQIYKENSFIVKFPNFPIPKFQNFSILLQAAKMKSMERLFQIAGQQDKEVIQPVLSIRLGAKHCCFSITDFASGELQRLAYYTAEEVNEPFLTELFTAHPELNVSFYQVLVCYDHPESSLVPLKYFKQEDAGALLKALYGINAEASVLVDPVDQWQLYNVFAVPKEVHDRMIRKFAFGKYLHQYTLGINNMNGKHPGGDLRVDFRKEDFIVLATKGNDLLLAKTYLYSTPADVLYYLLRICRQFGLSQQEVQIDLSGLVDQQSALYRELDQYFLNIAFRQSPWAITASNDSPDPAHFFTSLNELSRCAS